MNIPRNTLQGRHFLPFGEAVFAVKMAAMAMGVWRFAMGHSHEGRALALLGAAPTAPLYVDGRAFGGDLRSSID